MALRLRRIVNFDHGWTRLTILRSGNSLPGAATDLGIWYSARLAFRSRMLGSVDAPEPGFRPSVRWGCHGGILQTVGRSETLPSTPHITWLWSPGPAASCQSFGSASVLGGNTSPGPRGAGAEGHPGMLDRRPLAAWPNCGPCAEYSPPKFIGGLALTVMDGGRILRHPSAAAWAACRRPLRSFSFPYTISACRRRA